MKFSSRRRQTKKIERSERSDGVVRIKVVVSQEELKQILRCGKGDKESVEKILENAMKLRGVTREISSNWRPALESIPEEQ